MNEGLMLLVLKKMRFATHALSVAILVALAVGAFPCTASAQTSALVVFDNTGPYRMPNQLHAQFTANLCGRFGSVTAKPAESYVQGDLAKHTALIYVGSTYDEPLSSAFLADVLATDKPVVWMYNNIWQLTAADSSFTTRFGWNWNMYDYSSVTQVVYKGKALTRHPLNAAGIMTYSVLDTNVVTVLAEAVREDGSRFPWAIRSGHLTYIGELPFPYMTETDRYLIFADLLFDALAPNTPTRRRALVRIEDVGPDADPAELRAIADYLYGQKVPFSAAVYTRYVDPRGVYNNGKAVDLRMRAAPAVVSALKYMAARKCTLLAHGHTHQYRKALNPYTGASGDDFEFYLAHVDENDYVIYDGPVPEDSAAWADGRLLGTIKEFKASGLPVPTIFEFPHYAGSATDYLAVKKRFKARYERSLFFPGFLTGEPLDYARMGGQFFPYVVTDVYGMKVIPENLGNYEPEAFNNHPARLPADIVRAAELNLVVRDGFASFFYHPYLGVDGLKEIVTGIKRLGYTFVAPTSL